MYSLQDEFFFSYYSRHHWSYACPVWEQKYLPSSCYKNQHRNPAFSWDSGIANEPFLLAWKDSYLKQMTSELWKLSPTQYYWDLASYQWRQSFYDWINYLGMGCCLCASWEPHFTVPCTSSTHWQKPDFPAGCLTILAWLLSKCGLGAGSSVAFSILLAQTLLRHQLGAQFLKPAVSIC